MNKLEMVKQWRRTFGLSVSEKPVVLSADQLKLHAKLISDEADEILGVFNVDGEIDEIKLRDVAGDLLYFALGLMAEAGIEFRESLTSYRAESLKLEGTHKITDVKEYIQAQCERLTDDSLEIWDIDEIAHNIATNAMLLVWLLDLQDHLDSDFEKIHVKNMAKLWKTEQVLALSDGKEKWFTFHGEGVTHCHHRDANGEWVSAEAPNSKGLYVVRLNGKVQKPPGWVPAQLEGGAV